MFGRIAGRYDLLNRLMTLGRDRAWRRETIRRLLGSPCRDGIYLDAGCGTGDLAYELCRQAPGSTVVATDLTFEMIAAGQKHPGAETVAWVIADAQHLPFRNAAFDGVVSGYLLRNVADLDQTLEEQRRVLRSAGSLTALDTTRPSRNLLLPFIQAYYKWGIPLLGKLIAGDSTAYTYLPETSARFLSAESLAEKLKERGFEQVGFVRRMLGTMAIHWGEKK